MLLLQAFLRCLPLPPITFGPLYRERENRVVRGILPLSEDVLPIGSASCGRTPHHRQHPRVVPHVLVSLGSSLLFGTYPQVRILSLLTLPACHPLGNRLGNWLSNPIRWLERRLTIDRNSRLPLEDFVCRQLLAMSLELC